MAVSNRNAEEAEIVQEEHFEDFLKGFIIALGFIAVSTLLIFIPPIEVGILLTLTLGPFIAGYKGGRHTHHWIWLGPIVGLMWSGLQIIFIIYLAEQLSIQKTASISWIESWLIVLIFALNIFFCTVGAKMGSQTPILKKSEE